MADTEKGATKLAVAQTLTGNYAVTSTVGSFEIARESLATLEIIYTTGAAEADNSMQFKLEFSHDNSTWVQESYSSLSSGTDTLAPVEHTIAGAAAATAYTAHYLVPFNARYAKVSVKETGVAANYGNVTIVLTTSSASGQSRTLSAFSATIAGGATEAKQDDQITLLTTIDADTSTIAGDTTSIDGKITACNTGAVTVATNVTAIQGPGNPTVDSYASVAINLTTGADQVLVSSAASKQIWVYGVTLTCGDADGQTVLFEDEDGTALTGVMEFKQYGGMAHSPSGNFAMPLWKLATDKDLTITITGGDVDGFLTYAIISV